MLKKLKQKTESKRNSKNLYKDCFQLKIKRDYNEQ